MKKILALIGLGLVAISGNAFAEDAKAYNGQGCDNYFARDNAQFNHQFNGISNNDSIAHLISCPIVVDETFNISGTNEVYVRWSGSGNTTLSCYLYSFDYYGNVKQSQSGSKTGGGWLTIPNLTADDYLGSYSMYCSLPAGGVLQTYWIGEQD